MAIELYNDGVHACYAFEDLVKGEGVQSNQFLIVDHHHAALLDPGGELTYTRLFMEISDHINVRELDYVVGSHQDPDIVASLNKWLTGTDCKIVVPKLWERFIPHYTKPGKTLGRILAIPDQGMELELGSIKLKALPAHFLHSEGNFQFYDPVGKVLFSGDMGANLHDADLSSPVDDFDAVVPYMEAFHRRYMSSNRVCRLWANMVRQLDVEWLVPQHGRSFKGKQMVERFLGWIESLPCGVDLMTQDNYRVP
jgi:flavorubredoxin